MPLGYVSFYNQIEQNGVGDVFSSTLGLRDNVADMLCAHGDKCYQYREVGEKHGVEFYQLVMVYLLSHDLPYSKTVRDTPNGWVGLPEWLDMMLQKPEIKDALSKSIYQP